MNNKTIPSQSTFPFSQTAFLTLLVLVILINLQPLCVELDKVYHNRKILPYNLVGYKFLGLEEFIGDETFVGYYTNENMDDKNPQKMFAQAQYVLAPTVLDFGNFNHRYIIFACSSQEEALRKMNEIDAEPLVRNQYNIILAKRKGL